MFTGIVEETGEVLAVAEEEGGVRLRLGTTFEPAAGASVSVSGACLTVEDSGEREAGDRWFSVFLAAETRARTYLDELEPGDRVNLERAMPADGRFGGHVVQGHVDATAEVRGVESVGEDWRFAFSIPEAVDRYLVEKGFVAVDGASLTVAARSEDAFEVAVVPETYRRTTLSGKSEGDPVNLEVDVIAKYVERLLEADE